MAEAAGLLRSIGGDPVTAVVAIALAAGWLIDRIMRQREAENGKSDTAEALAVAGIKNDMQRLSDRLDQHFGSAREYDERSYKEIRHSIANCMTAINLLVETTKNWKNL